MAKMNILLPAMGEGVIEATITKWLVNEGTEVKQDDPLVEVATDKVDSEIPAPAEGKIVEIVAKEGTVPRVGDLLAIIENEAVETKEKAEKVEKEIQRVRETIDSNRQELKEAEKVSGGMKSRTPSGKFISPLVRSMASLEGISYQELDNITGTGMDGRITKDDFQKYLEEKKSGKKEPEIKPQREPVPEIQPKREPEPQIRPQREPEPEIKPRPEPAPEIQPQKEPVPEIKPPSAQPQQGDEIIPMDRVRKLIAEHMVMSK
jgi:2-oxoglutarate dehydrogenase E2 component (dihydrolipoamide succinyltransferase)